MIFTFLVVTYNHEAYIIQNLESIKYQIQNYGKDFDFQLIVTDDCSKDNTIKYVKYWVENNKGLFKYIDIISNVVNKGTCKNYIRGIRLFKGDYIKLVAGDDLFPEGNIFEFAKNLNNCDIVMGLPVAFRENFIDSSNNKFIRSLISVEIASKKSLFNQRIRRSCFLNAPSVFLRKEFLQNKEVIDFLDSYKVLDDYTQWIKIAEVFENINYKFIPKVAVLYRRTSGSAYIVKKNDFYRDKVRLYKYIIENETNLLNRTLQYNASFCFQSNSLLIQKYFMLIKYAHLFTRILYSRQTKKMFKNIEFEIESNKKYLKKIVAKANQILLEISNVNRELNK